MAREPAAGGTILVIDDDELMRDSLREALSRKGYSVRATADGASGLAALREEEADAVVCDLRMAGMSGLEVCEKIAALGPAAPPLVVVTAFGSVETAVQAMKLGAFDYVTKPFKAEELSVRHGEGAPPPADPAREPVLRAELVGAPDRFDARRAEPGHVPPARPDRPLAPRPTPRCSSRARAARARSWSRGPSTPARRGATGPFVAVNCAALPETLLESELFGHEKGAFTGADRTAQGAASSWPTAGRSSSTRSATSSPKLQAKLLRVLQEREVRAGRGATRPSRSTCASSPPPTGTSSSEVRGGRFREDLYYRLNVFPIDAPPAARAAGGHPAPGRPLPRGLRRQEQGASAQVTPDAAMAAPPELPLAGERARAGERDRARLGAGRRPGAGPGRLPRPRRRPGARLRGRPPRGTGQAGGTEHGGGGAGDDPRRPPALPRAPAADGERAGHRRADPAHQDQEVGPRGRGPRPLAAAGRN